MNKLNLGLYKLISNVVKREHVTPDNEVLIPIPKEQIDNKEDKAVRFVKKSGEINRDSELPIRVKIEPVRTKHKEKTYETINIIFKFDSQLDLNKLRTKLNIPKYILVRSVGVLKYQKEQ